MGKLQKRYYLLANETAVPVEQRKNCRRLTHAQDGRRYRAEKLFYDAVFWFRYLQKYFANFQSQKVFSQMGWLAEKEP